jgi:hypothetical protein
MDDECERNEKLPTAPAVGASWVGFGWDLVICASSFRHILAHQLFLLGALVSFLAADQALVIKID